LATALVFTRRLRRSAGFTLLELLVATGVLTVLGTAVVVILRGGIKTWRRGETRRESFEVAQAVLGQLQDDLGAATIDPDTSFGGRTVEAVFFGDRDASGRSFVTLVRTIRGESESTITGNAGSAIGGDARIDYRDDMKKAIDGRLRATGGLMEIAYTMGERGTPDEEVLFRGIRTPIGGRTSFFAVPQFFHAPLPGMPAPKETPPEGVALLRAFASHVLYFELLYATPYSTTWALDVPPRKDGGASGPLTYWDSTRSMPPAGEPDPKIFGTYVDKSSAADPRDDILPPRVKVTLVVREGEAAESSTMLLQELNPTATSFVVAEPDRVPKPGFVFLDEEWIEVDDATGARVHVKARGARSTQPAAHRSGAEVVVGRTFEAVVPLAAAREDWRPR
jgi:type II secretory pathway pseudopilin PulG